jgi:eukaryotic-like serine/threonine-protein kinase
LAGRDSTAVSLQGSDLFAVNLELVDSASSTRVALMSASWIHACLRIIRDVANALAHAHEVGIVHRDAEPGNVMLDDDGRTRLLGFGLARDDEAQTLTRTGTALGSLAYMSPEQLLGERDKKLMRAPTSTPWTWCCSSC